MARHSDERDEETFSAKGAQEKAGGNGGRETTGQTTDAIEMLKADHRRVEQLFDKYQEARRRAEKSRLAQQICLELTIHAQLEEEIFYPACREHVDDPQLDEAQVEHDTVKILTAEVAMGTPSADPFFDAKVKVLAEYVRHHVQEEEKSAESIFAKAQEGGVDTAALGRRMMERREELMEAFSEELLLPQPKTLHLTLEQEEEVWSEPPAGAMRGGGRGRAAQGRGGESERGAWEGRGEDRWQAREGAYDERRASRGGGWEEQREGGRESQRGWHGDPQGHAQAARRGWEEREERGYDERRSARGGGREEGREGGRESQRGWRGDPEGHAQAARRGWEEREGGEARQSRGRAEDRGGGQAHKGWVGDPKRHSEASRRGWEHRR